MSSRHGKFALAGQGNEPDMPRRNLLLLRFTRAGWTRTQRDRQ